MCCRPTGWTDRCGLPSSGRQSANYTRQGTSDVLDSGQGRLLRKDWHYQMCETIWNFMLYHSFLHRPSTIGSWSTRRDSSVGIDVCLFVEGSREHSSIPGRHKILLSAANRPDWLRGLASRSWTTWLQLQVSSGQGVQRNTEHLPLYRKLCKYRVILPVLGPRKCENFKDYSLDFEHVYMTTYLASW
jgi:hypothetical protein